MNSRQPPKRWDGANSGRVTTLEDERMQSYVYALPRPLPRKAFFCLHERKEHHVHHIYDIPKVLLHF